MRLLRLRENGALTLTPDLKSDLPRYAILSHTWGPEDEELTLEDIQNGAGRDKAGYAKVALCGERARGDGLDHFWVDSCCIDRANSAELSEAIISMFGWYGRAEKCYVHLSDVTAGEGWERAFGESRWFRRGWTLQELLAPRVVEFYSREGRLLGDRRGLAALVQAASGIPWSALQGADLAAFSVDERLSWSAGRVTTREEDRAYCLLGIFNVFIPPMYGEGGNAYVRLEEEIAKRYRGPSGSATIAQSRGAEADAGDAGSAAVLDSLPVAGRAAFDSISKQDDPLCLPDTRVDVMKRIRAWVYGEEQSCIFWLNGMAGTGKSTIARTIARELKGQGCLGASFFFSRGDGDLAHAEMFFTTISRQLAMLHPFVRRQLVRALVKEPDLASKTRRDQWNKMIVEPLNNAPASALPRSLIIVIDALDECSSDNDIKGIIKILSEANSVVSLRLRIIITSRPETPIRLGFKLMPQVMHQDLLLHDERRDVVDADICLYLYDEFEKIKMTQDWLLEDWPGIDVVNRLVGLAGGLFIFAATVCRFIVEDDNRGADSSLDAFLQGSCGESSEFLDIDPGHINDPTATLDRLYAQVLRKSLQQIGPLLDTLWAIANLCEPLTPTALARLLSVRPGDIHKQLNKLHSVVHVSAGELDPIRLIHASFRDFLLDEERCSIIYHDSGAESREPLKLNSQRLHWKLTLQCLRLLSRNGQLRRDICSLNRPGVSRGEVREETIAKAIPADMSYACRYWVYHLQQSGHSIRDNDEIHMFLEGYWLYWIEALSWLEWLSNSLDQMNILQGLSRRDGNLGNLIHDATRFLMSNRSIVDEAPLQLYCAALIFAPSQCPIRTRFHHDMMVHLDIAPRIPETWGPELFKFEGHGSRIYSVCASSDGQLIASGSGGNTASIWDLASGKLLQYLGIPNEFANVVSLAPDGQRIAAGLASGELWLWMTLTGDLVFRLEVERAPIIAVTFSPDGEHIIAGSQNGTVWMREISGPCIKQFKMSVDQISSLVASPDGQHVAISASDRTVWTWNLLTNEMIQLPVRYSFQVYAMAFGQGTQLTVGGWHGEGNVLHAAHGSQTRQFRGHGSAIQCMAFSRDVHQIAAGARDHSVRVWSTETGQQTQMFIGHEERIRDLTFSPSGERIVSASDDGTLRVWDTTTIERSHDFRRNDDITGLRFSPDGRQVAAISGGKLQLWETTTGEQMRQLRERWIHPVAVDFSPDGRLVAAISDDPAYPTVQLWDAETGEQIWRLWGSGVPISRIAFSPDGQLLAAGSESGTLQVWQVATCEQISYVAEPLAGLSSMIFSPDGETIALGGEDHSLRLWDIMTAEIVLSSKHEDVHDRCDHGIAFSSDGQMFAEGSSGLVTIWAVALREPMVGLEGHGGNYKSVAFSPRGDLVAAYSLEVDTIDIWDIATGHLTKMLEGFPLLSAISFSADAKYLNTNIGRLRLDEDAPPASIRMAGRWIRRNGEDVLWLPYEHHGYRSIFHGDTLVLVQLCGELSFIRFR